MVEQHGITTAEIAERYGRALRTVQDVWRKHPDWPAPTGKRGRWAEYDAQAVDELVRRAFLRDPPSAEGRPDDLLTIAQIVEYTGLTRSTIDSDISRGRIPPPDDTEHGVKRWRRSTVDTAMSQRRGYRRSTPST
ncbi:hypothetical protein [Nonomuraea sp. NPDC049709]|uniref:helix-turn-helix transcriptional regulator n=1 Tax=Nonomuraea sp. NPDC049709 TaxID=3154736 RepID=UPI003440DFEE